MMKLADRDVAAFFHGLQYYIGVSRDARQALDSALGESFTVFDYLNPNENLLSRIIADLLNPKGAHGQGSTFMVAFLEQLDHANCSLPPGWRSLAEAATVVNEAATSFLCNSARRIDIRVELPGHFGIGIENKPWATEQEGQLSDYHIELDRRYQGRSVLIFLCQRGRIPVSMSDQEWSNLARSGRVAVLHYPDGFLDWLNECSMRVQADKIRHFLKDFIRYVRKDLSGIDQEEG